MNSLNALLMIILIGFVIIGGCVYVGITHQPIIVQQNIISETTTTAAVSKAPSVATIDSTPLILTCGAQNDTIVTKIIDGDTVIVQGGYHVRLLGIDADEKNYPCYESAKNRLEILVLNKKIRLEEDITDVDQYGRCLRTIFLGDKNIDAQLVKEGLAVARFYPPDVQYKKEITLAETYAIENHIGCKWKNK